MNLELIFKLTPIVVSLVAIGFTILQAERTRRHNRLSVRPYLVYNNEKNRGEKEVCYRFEIRNYGIGPAKITGFSLYLNEKRFMPKVYPIQEIIEACIGDKVEKTIRSASFPGNGYCLKAGSEYLLLSLVFPKLPQTSEGVVESYINQIDFHINYESFYGEKFSLSTKETTTNHQDLKGNV